MTSLQPASTEDPDAYFVRLAPGSFRPTRHTTGAWSVTEQHISPLNGLVVHAIEQYAASGSVGEETKSVGRVSFDILGPVPVEEFDIAVEVVRPGRTIELVEARVLSGGREVLRAGAWRLAAYDTRAVRGGQPGDIPAADTLPLWDMTTVWPGGYIASLEVRRSPDTVPGRTTVWLSTPLDLLADEPVSALAQFVALVDTANGVCVRESPQEWMFPNVDLTIHLHRRPEPGPVGLDTTVTFGAGGQGLTSTTLYDRHGPVGLAAQVLTVRPRG